MIADQFGDGWHKYIIDIFGGFLVLGGDLVFGGVACFFFF